MTEIDGQMIDDRDDRISDLEAQNKRLVAFHNAWVNFQVSNATGNPDLVKEMRQKMIEAHKAVNASR